MAEIIEHLKDEEDKELIRLLNEMRRRTDAEFVELRQLMQKVRDKYSVDNSSKGNDLPRIIKNR